MLDRTRFENAHWWPIPHEFEDDDHHPYNHAQWNKTDHTEEEELARKRAILENKKERIRAVNFLMSDATKAMESLHRSLQYEIEKEDEAPPKQVDHRIKQLESIKEEWSGDVFAYWRKQGYAVDETSRTRTYVSKYSDKVNKPRPIGEKPADFDQLMAELDRLKKWQYPEPLPWDTVPKIPY